MTRECVEGGSPFGMLLALENGIVRVGCTAEILEITKTHADGRMDILTVGRDPFRIVELFTEDPLLEGQVEYLEDREWKGSPALRGKLVELYETCHTLLFGSMPGDLRKVQEAMLTYAIASALPMELLWKQQLLELREEEERRERLLTYLREWAPHLQKAEVQRHKAAGNGHGMN
jgi:Lon protease-like protein